MSILLALDPAGLHTVPVAVLIDTRLPLRSSEELAGLVNAVVAASANDETDWLEWKSGLDLKRKENQVTIARHILGMANRRVADATRQAGGCGYLVIGAEPGSVAGVAEVDPADLSQAIQIYLGSAGPSWSASYIPTARAGSRGQRLEKINDAVEKLFGEVVNANPSDRPPSRWYTPRNRLRILLIGLEGQLPICVQIVNAGSAYQALNLIPSARNEIAAALWQLGQQNRSPSRSDGT